MLGLPIVLMHYNELCVYGKKGDTFIMYTEIHGHIVTDDPPLPE